MAAARTTLTADERADALALIRAGLREDVGPGDITTAATVGPHARARATLIARERGVIAGLPLATLVFETLAPGAIRVATRCADGETLEPGQTVAVLEGSAAAVLTGERLALNLLQRLSGTATLTRRFVEAVGATGARIFDTRKTCPGMRRLQKYAVRAGGGHNHRIGLWDAGLIKENHIAVLAAEAGCAPHEVDLGPTVRRIRALRPGCAVEIEVEDPRALERAIAAGPDAILLDNMAPETLAAVVARARELARRHGLDVEIEASGGITLQTAAAIARTGVDRLSVGALTHSAPALDLSLRFAVGREP